MKSYIGVKRIKAKPMTRIHYNEYRGWELPKDEDGSDEGYLVEYVDGGKSNHPNHESYISWSPEEVFNKAYRKVSGMNFGFAIEALRAGARVCRSGWNGKGVYLVLIDGASGVKRAGYDGENRHIPLSMHIAIDTTGLKRDNICVVPWLASHTDMLADDWSVV